MKLNAPGVMPRSEIYFSTPSPMTKKLLYYPIAAGHFYCNDTYRVARKQYNSFLAFCVIKGQLKFVNENKKISIANAGEVVLINCYNPHEYFCDTSLESIWFHFDGANTVSLCTEIVKNNTQVIRDDVRGSLSTLFHQIATDIASGTTSEILLSGRIYSLMCQMLLPTASLNDKNITATNNVEQAKTFITNNLNEKLSVKSIADHLHLSPTYFSRVFKKQTGFAPYDYILVSRLDKAKDLLQKTGLSISDIAYKIGFGSEANFIYFFKKQTGLSPKKFRDLKF